MAYQRRTVITRGGSAYIKCFHSMQFQSKCETRRRRTKPTKASVAEANRKASLEKLTWELNENFCIDDWWATLTYREPLSKARTYEEIKDDLRLFLRRMRNSCRKQGIEFKCKFSIEVGKKGARHIHMVMNRVDAALVRKAWTFGIADLRAVYPQTDKGTFDEIAAYMIKDSDKTRQVLGNDRIPRYSGTRNLRQPPIEIKPLLRDTFSADKPFVPKGFRLVPDSVVENENEYGYKTLEYICLRC